jgi:von Willebrand factor type A domain
MSSFNIETTENYFNSLMEVASLEFHTKSPMPISIFTEPDTKFGVFKLKPEKCEPSTTPMVIQCTIDISSSMNESVSTTSMDNKIDFIKQTLEKMLSYLLDNFNIEIWIHIGLFNTCYMTLIPMQSLLRDNLAEIIEKIRSIRCNGCTNIEKAFIESRNIMETSISQRPRYKHLHMFLTDGNATDGIHDSAILSKLISTQYPTLFIGYGTDHNASLLKNCANHLSHSYQFVDNFELTGQVYAEMLYSIMYTVLENPVIEIECGCIYDSLNDQWTNRMEIPFWVAEKEYVYHISALNPDDTLIRIYKDDQQLFSTSELPLLMDAETNEIEVRNFDKYIFKQKTMELLSLALHIQSRTDEIDPTEQLKPVQKEMSDLFKRLRTYMRENDLLEDAFLKILCEDLSISYQSIKMQLDNHMYDTNYATMNILSRRNAQATQALYRSGSARRPQQTTMHHIPFSGLQRTATSCRDSDAETQVDDWTENDREHEFVDGESERIDGEDTIDTYQEEFVTQNIYSPSGMDTMARNISN